jgi:hypothetical protein
MSGAWFCEGIMRQKALQSQQVRLCDTGSFADRVVKVLQNKNNAKKRVGAVGTFVAGLS